MYKILLEMRATEETERTPRSIWKLVESEDLPANEAQCVIRGEGIPHRVRYEEVEEPARDSDPYTAFIYAPSDHLEHALQKHGWAESESEAMLTDA